MSIFGIVAVRLPSHRSPTNHNNSIIQDDRIIIIVQYSIGYNLIISWIMVCIIIMMMFVANDGCDGALGERAGVDEEE